MPLYRSQDLVTALEKHALHPYLYRRRVCLQLDESPKPGLLRLETVPLKGGTQVVLSGSKGIVHTLQASCQTMDEIVRTFLYTWNNRERYLDAYHSGKYDS